MLVRVYILEMIIEWILKIHPLYYNHKLVVIEEVTVLYLNSCRCQSVILLTKPLKQIFVIVKSKLMATVLTVIS